MIDAIAWLCTIVVMALLYGLFYKLFLKGEVKKQRELRDIQIKFYVTEEEKHLIEQKMQQLPTQRYGAYLRKMAIDGYIINMDTTDIKAFTAELGAIGRNINQIAKRVNAGGSVYKEDIQEIRERLDEIWLLQRRILSNQP